MDGDAVQLKASVFKIENAIIIFFQQLRLRFALEQKQTVMDSTGKTTVTRTSLRLNPKSRKNDFFRVFHDVLYLVYRPNHIFFP